MKHPVDVLMFIYSMCAINPDLYPQISKQHPQTHTYLWTSSVCSVFTWKPDLTIFKFLIISKQNWQEECQVTVTQIHIAGSITQTLVTFLICCLEALAMKMINVQGVLKNDAANELMIFRGISNLLPAIKCSCKVNDFH